MGDPEASPPPADTGSGGLWMFKQNGMVFGPVAARLLLDKLYSGEIDADTQVAREEDEHFRSMAEVAFFTVHLAKAQAKLKVEKEENQHVATERRGTQTRAAVAITVVVTVVGLVGGGLYFAFVQHQKKLAQEVDEIPIISNPPEFAEATKPAARDDDVRLPTAAPAPVPGHRAPGHRPPVPGTAPTGNEAPTAQYDKSSIIAAEVRQKGALIPCIKQELRREPDFRGEIKFSVAIGNDGKVAKLWMEDHQFKDGPLEQCFFQAMGHWHFAPYEGERATMSDSFHVGR